MDSLLITPVLAIRFMKVLFTGGKARFPAQCE
jgi:hypothetical protein